MEKIKTLGKQFKVGDYLMYRHKIYKVVDVSEKIIKVSSGVYNLLNLKSNNYYNRCV